MTQDAGTGEDCSPFSRIAAREGGKGEDRGRAISESEQTVKKTIKYLYPCVNPHHVMYSMHLFSR